VESLIPVNPYSKSSPNLNYVDYLILVIQDQYLQFNHFGFIWFETCFQVISSLFH